MIDKSIDYLTITDRTLDIVFSRFRDFSLTLTLRQKPKEVTCMWRRTCSLSVSNSTQHARNSIGRLPPDKSTLKVCIRYHSLQIEVSRKERVHARSYVCSKLTWTPTGKIKHSLRVYFEQKTAKFWNLVLYLLLLINLLTKLSFGSGIVIFAWSYYWEEITVS